MCCKIVIPSHKRHDRVLSKKLINGGIICVEESQKEIYKEYNPDSEIVCHPDSIKGLIPKRNWIYNYFGDVFMIDDDVNYFHKTYIKPGESSKITEKSQITNHIYMLYDLSKLMGISLFGFTKNPNPVQYNCFRPLSLQNMITGCAYGVIKSKNIYWNEDLKLKEDFWISNYIKFKERKILIDTRFNFTQKDTFINSGGLSEIRNQEQEKHDMLKMRQLFGETVQLKIDRKTAKMAKKYNIFVKYTF